MGRINLRRVLLGGLGAGVVITVFEVVLNTIQLVSGAWAEALKRMGNPEEFSNTQIGQFTVLAFALGILMVWLYAAIRPRFGPGPATAGIAGVSLWIVSLIANISLGIMNAFPAEFLLVATIVRAFEYVAASMAGAALYKE